MLMAKRWPDAQEFDSKRLLMGEIAIEIKVYSYLHPSLLLDELGKKIEETRLSLCDMAMTVSYSNAMERIRGSITTFIKRVKVIW